MVSVRPPPTHRTAPVTCTHLKKAYQFEKKLLLKMKTSARARTVRPTTAVTVFEARRSGVASEECGVSMAASKRDAADGYKARAASISTSRSGSSLGS